ncbi:hypothetical protein [Anaerorhabdus sp.]|uniref:hypothetical protein n=1 Tax=Anaerorhabdus sp. TaxID=1872524 RepID=UPI002FCC2704
MKTYEEMVALFEKANDRFLSKNIDILTRDISERTLCGALMLEIYEIIRENSDYEGYYVDVEYNRNIGHIDDRKRTSEEVNKNINCDLILHSRGKIAEQDNLIALEMKKSNRPPSEKRDDKKRLRSLTRIPKNINEFKSDLPEFVCGYQLGIYYEINYKKDSIALIFYRDGIESDKDCIFLENYRSN